MSDYIERLERELLGKGAQFHSQPRSARLRWRSTFSVLAAGMATAVVIAVAVIAAVHTGHRTSAQHQLRKSHFKPAPNNAVQPQRAVGACRDRTVGTRHDVLPRLVYSNARPAVGLLNELAVLRRGAPYPIDRRTFNSSPNTVIRIYSRYVRAVSGPGHTRIVLSPAVACSFPLRNIYHRPVQTPRAVLLMQLVGPNFELPPPTILVGTAQQIAHTLITPGLGTKNRAWFQSVIVPDGVARVRLDFAPSYRINYTRMITIHDNTGSAFPLRPYVPITVTWYGPNGRIIHRFVDQEVTRFNRCRAQHRGNCA